MTINLKGLENCRFFNASDDVESYVDSGIVFNDAYHLAESDVAAGKRHRHERCFAQNRVYNLYQHHRRDLRFIKPPECTLESRLVSTLRLTDKNGEIQLTRLAMLMVDGARTHRAILWDLPDAQS